MAKKPSSKGSGGSKEMTSDKHRKLSAQLHAKARLHDAKADLMDAKNPPKNRPVRGCY